MTYSALMIQPAKVVKAGVKLSRAGDETADWDNPASVVDVTCWVGPMRASEDEGLTDEAILEAQFFFQPNVDIENEDRIEWGGHTYQVIGPPIPKYTVRGLHHYEVNGRGSL